MAYEEPIIELEEVDLPSKRTIVKSAISFPYTNLEEIATLAKAMSDRGGVPLTRDQVADALNTHENSTFSLKIAAARLFDVVSFADGKFSLTMIGYGLVADDEDVVKAARRDAFWSVELYRKVFEHFRGKLLPPRSGMENVLISLGVSEKRAEKARQIFERSAQFAGFLSANKDRLVQPLIFEKPQNSADDFRKFVNSLPEQPVAMERKIENTEVDKDPLQEPLIHGMLTRLPKIGSVWDIADRVKWLRTLVGNFNTVYEDVDVDDGKEWEITIGLKTIG